MASEEVSGIRPLLVLERIERDQDTPNQMVGTALFGGHRLDVELEFMPQFPRVHPFREGA
jgi:hypothetical protein